MCNKMKSYSFFVYDSVFDNNTDDEQQGTKKRIPKLDEPDLQMRQLKL